MSVSPTEDTLIVALDFEGEIECIILNGFIVTSTSRATGIHSLENSAQEDTLLVLFNTAISNLVCRLPHLDIGFLSYHHQ
jgi:hypothetical protein